MRTDHDTQRTVQFRRHEHLAHKGEVQEQVLKIREGWASRYCLLPDGRRQITALYLPGDYCEAQWLLSGKSTLPIVALTAVRAQAIPLASVHGQPGDAVMKLLEGTLKAYDRQTAWIVSLGRKSAIERVTDLLVELFERLCAHDRIIDNRFTMPLTQQDIADAVGLTPVHVNRVLGELRSRKLIGITGKTVHFPNPQALGIALPASGPSVSVPGAPDGALAA